MQKIAIANMKGGVGKTTTAIILADALSAVARRSVLALDLDPQANMSWALLSPSRFQSHGESTLTRWLKRVSARSADNTFSDALEVVGLRPDSAGKAGLAAQSNLQLAVADTRMRFAEMEFDGRPTEPAPKRLHRAFTQALEAASPNFDFCVMDCCPALSALTLVGLQHADAIVVPTPLNRLCLESLETFRERAVNELLNLSTPIFVVPTRVGRSGGAAEQANVRETLRRREAEGAWTVIDPEFKECAAYTRALDPPETGAFQSLRSKYGNQRADLNRLYSSLIDKGAIHE